MFWRFAYIIVFLIPSVAAADNTASPVSQPANPPLRFKWQQNQTLTYKVLQRTVVKETSLDEKSGKSVMTEAGTNLLIVKKWGVKEIDSAGVATLEMTIT